MKPDGSVDVAADGLEFPNGTVITPDGRTLIVGESMGRRATAFAIAPDGTLRDRRLWAELGEVIPDGCTLDADGAIWFADAAGPPSSGCGKAARSPIGSRRDSTRSRARSAATTAAPCSWSAPTASVRVRRARPPAPSAPAGRRPPRGPALRGVGVPALPSGTVTFLFTDIEGSTRLWEEHPEAMKAALARHDAILVDAVVAHGGTVVKTTGDGVHAVFPVAGDGVAAALDGQLGLVREPWGATGPISVRMGLHTGTAEVRDGDYYGSVLNRAARLMSVAHGGQVVVSQLTEQLTRDSLASDVELLDLGEHRLRDLAAPMQVFQVIRDGLERDVPSAALARRDGWEPPRADQLVRRARARPRASG